MNLTTKYMGLELKNPVVASASPLSKSADGIKKLEDAGVSAVVMYSLFEEQVKTEDADFDYFTTYGTEFYSESLSYFPSTEDYGSSADEYLNTISKAAESCEIPIIGSLNGVSNKGWIEYAKKMVDAGAKGIELNIYFLPTDLTLTGNEVEKRYLDILKAVKDCVDVPVAVKLSPYFSSIANMAKQLDDAGADALVLFNRFYQPDFNINAMEVDCTLELSTPSEIRLPLLWTAVLSGKLNASVGATTGVHSSTEAVKYILAGADVVMPASALVKGGAAAATPIITGLESWLQGRGYDSIDEARGAMDQQSVADPDAFERANYIKVLKSVKIDEMQSF